MKKQIDFVSKFKYFGIFSATLVILSVIFMFKGFNLGIDFTGGIGIEFKEDSSNLITVDLLRSQFAKSEKFENIQIQKIESENLFSIKYGIKSKNDFSQTSIELKKFIQEQNPRPDIIFEKTDYISEQIGKTYIRKAIIAVIMAVFGIFIYIFSRFSIAYSIGAVVTLVHDMVFTIGFICATQMLFDISAIAAILTILGYSVNDTVIIYDRIRKNLGQTKINKIETLKDAFNSSLNATLTRTILTSFATMLSVFAVVVFGGYVIRDFALIVLFGIFIGTISSITISSTCTYLVMKRKCKNTK